MKLNQAVDKERARPKDWGFAESEKTGTQYLWIDFVFPEIITDPVEEVELRHRMYLTDKTFDYVLRDLETMGWKGKNISELEKGHADSFDLSQAEVLITTEMQTYEGKPQCKVKYINDPNYAPDKTIDAQNLKKLSEKMKAKIAAFRSKSSTNGTAKKETAKEPAAS